MAMTFDQYGTTSPTPSGSKGWLLALQHRQRFPECDVREVSLVSGGIPARCCQVSIQAVTLKDLEQSLNSKVVGSIQRHCQSIPANLWRRIGVEPYRGREESASGYDSRSGKS
ncbi:hypothetical protein VPNG_06040 [Cytospora leucostoma]|uniref:Uncharacterized protein n=1 Tax=Cytospora leucostoma TaxID=1230097 RepID=A0A423WWZ6_9PEZI|nr:hypothetical protein VPNG_06040 [Cytospora leucostoma]